MSDSDPPHVIRLRKPWQKTVAEIEAPLRIDVPEPADETAPLKSATYQRRFNRPSGLTHETSVLLRFESWLGQIVSLKVNTTQFAATDPPIEIDVTSVLESHNTITLEVACDGDTSPRLSGEVTLVIK